MKIAVCDDFLYDLNDTMKKIKNVCRRMQISSECDIYTSGEDLLASIQNKKAEYDLILLDIFMSGTGGIETAEALKKILPDAEIAFISTSGDFGIEIYALNALHYILKPISEDDVEELLKRFLSKNKIPMKKLEIKSGGKIYGFPYHTVEKIQSCNKGVDIYTSNKQEPVHISASFSFVEEQLDGNYFIRISRGLIVAMPFISYISKGVCVFKDSTKTLISRAEKDEITAKYNEYLFEKTGGQI